MSSRACTLPLLAALLLTPVLPPIEARAEAPERQILVPEGWEGAYEFGYAPAVRVGDQVIVSGIPAGGPGTYEEKIRRMYQTAGKLLAAAGATFADVVELTTFHTTAKDSAAFGQEFQLYMPIHKEFFGDHRPAWTAIGNAVLLSPQAPVEMRMVAVVGSGENSRVVWEKEQGEAEAKEEKAAAEEGKDGATAAPEAGPAGEEGDDSGGGQSGSDPAMAAQSDGEES